MLEESGGGRRSDRFGGGRRRGVGVDCRLHEFGGETRAGVDLHGVGEFVVEAFEGPAEAGEVFERRRAPVGFDPAVVFALVGDVGPGLGVEAEIEAGGEVEVVEIVLKPVFIDEQVDAGMAEESAGRVGGWRIVGPPPQREALAWFGARAAVGFFGGEQVEVVKTIVEVVSLFGRRIG